MAAIFDTLKFVKRAMENGFTEQQAEFQAKEFYNYIVNQAATKIDLELLKREIFIELKTLEQRLVIKLGGLMITGISILGFIIKH